MLGDGITKALAQLLIGFAILIVVASVVIVGASAYSNGGPKGVPGAALEGVPQPSAKGTIPASIVSGH